MELGLSTHWNASRNTDGEAMIRQILDLGIRRVELGYDLIYPLVDGVKKMVDSGEVKVDSVHNFCPVPPGAMQGHPELWELAASNERMRHAAVIHTRRTLEFAASMGAKTVVAHAGYAEIRMRTPDLIKLCDSGQQFSSKYELLRIKAIKDREKHVQPALDQLRRSLDELIPESKTMNIRLALESLPFWEAVPNEPEMRQLLDQYGTENFGYWHDIGHSQLRQKLGFIGSHMWLENLQDGLAGFHIHDLTRTAKDHIMPPNGEVDFAALGRFIRPGMPLVLEPGVGTTISDISRAIELLQGLWKDK